MRRFLVIPVAAALVLSLASPAEAKPIGVRTTRLDEWDPAAGPDHIAWVQNTRRDPDRARVYAKPTGGPKFRVNRGPGDAYSPGIDGTTLVYQQVRRGRSDIKMFDLITRRRSNPPAGVNTRRWEYTPDISGDWLLYAQAWRRFRNRRVVLFNTSSLVKRVLAKSRGRTLLVGGQVNGNYAVWGKVTRRGCDVFLHDIAAATTMKIPNPRPCQYGPSVTDTGTVYLGQSGLRCGQAARLVRYPLGGPATVLISFRKGVDFQNTYAFTDGGGSTHVFYDRGFCNRDFGENLFDVYKIID